MASHVQHPDEQIRERNIQLLAGQLDGHTQNTYLILLELRDQEMVLII